MNEKETREILDNMSEQEFNDFIFFALKEVEKENQKLKTELKKKDKIIDEMAKYDKNGNFIKEWTGIRNAAKKLKICGGRISACCKGKRKTVGNYIWRYKEGFDV